MGSKFSALIVGFALSMISVAAIQAAQGQTHEGTVVSAGGGKLVIKDASGKEETFAVGDEAKIIVHGKPGRLEDLKISMRVRVMTEAPSKVVAVATMDERK